MQKKIAKIIPATEARKEFFSILRDASQEKSYYVITVDGLPMATIDSFEKDKLFYEKPVGNKTNAKKPKAKRKIVGKRAKLPKR